ncbi:sortase domain-bontaining protein [Kocuria sp. M1R5S2]|uniref:class F sortase n=1 Tax=Kocuria rhizosphaerae TaxID=3376285 RepID=UPI003796882B
MTGSTTGRRAGLTALAAAAVLFASGCAGPDDGSAPTASGIATSSGPAPGPESPATTAASTSSPSDATRTPAPASAPSAMEASDPASLFVPGTGTRSELLHLGLRDDGSLQVPPEGPGSPASWYTGSPAPGEPGPAVLLGHVNATGGGPGVFADLRQLTPGDRIEVAREDGTTVVFVVERAEQYVKDDFPTLEVYGNTEGAELRLITCDGYDPATGEFDDNYVVYATLGS